MAIRAHASVRYMLLLALGITSCLSGIPLALAQDQQSQPQPASQQILTQQEIEQLVAPIALYPDPLLAQILTASTYPLEVVMAARWRQQNPNIKGADLEKAMQQRPWDPSVKGLTSVPQVLAMMNDKLDWTQQLGEAFLAQPNDVQNAIQTLRQKAESTGSLKSSKQQKVSTIPAPPSPNYVGPPEYIVIESAEPEYIYVPVYDPGVVFGVGFWEPAYRPFFWYPPWWTVGPAFGFGAALFVGPALWYHYNWGHGGYAAVQINRARYSQFNRVNLTGGQYQTWRFNPAHRGTVPFNNTTLQRQYKNVTGVQGIQTNKSIQGVTTNKTIQGVQSIQGIQTNKSIQGVTTNKTIQGVQSSKGSGIIRTNKSIQGVTTNRNIQGIQDSKGVQGVTTNKSSQGIHTNKGVRNIKTNKSIQGTHTSKSVQGIKTNKSIQGVRTNKTITPHGAKPTPKGVQKGNVKRIQQP
jgi:hypothetical protein